MVFKVVLQRGNAVMGADRETVQVVILLKSENTTNRQLLSWSFAFTSRFNLKNVYLLLISCDILPNYHFSYRSGQLK